MFSKTPRSISNFNSTEKNFMCLIGFGKKKKKGLSYNIFLVSKMCFKKTMSENKFSFEKLKQLLILILLQKVFMFKGSLDMSMVGVY